MNSQKGLLTKLAEVIDTHRAETIVRQQMSQKEVPPSYASHLRHWLVPNGGTLILVILLILTQNVWARPGAAFNAANTPGPSATTVNYQGRLADTGGNPKNGTFSMSFTLYDAATDGNIVWGPEVHPAVPVSEGLFSVGLGSLTGGGIPTTTWNGDIYLEVSVNGEALTPRELIRSVPIAGMALTVPDGAISEDKLSFRVPKLLDEKTCHDCKEVTETNLAQGWHPVKGLSDQDVIETTVTTQGGPVQVNMTARYVTQDLSTHWCAVYVYENGTRISRALLDGHANRSISAENTLDWGCSGSYLFVDLPAGTYTFQAMAFINPDTTITWIDHRQIAIFEY